jgi:hypothetical protein
MHPHGSHIGYCCVLHRVHSHLQIRFCVRGEVQVILSCSKQNDTACTATLANNNTMLPNKVMITFTYATL